MSRRIAACPPKAEPREHTIEARPSALAALVVAALLLVAGDVRADPFDLNDTTWEGCSELLEVLRTELGSERVRPIGVLNWEEVQPEDGVLAIHPLQAMDAEETAAFMNAGGRLAIADDYGLGDETLRRFHIERTSPPVRPVNALRNKPALAIAEPAVDQIAGRTTGPHPVAARVQQLVTNHPTGLIHPNLTPVLRIRAIGEADVTIAVAGQVGKGRLFAMSDPSAGINQMLRYPGNRAFWAGLARYLVDDDSVMHRQGRLFVLVNRFHEENSFGGRTSTRKQLENHWRNLSNALAEARRLGFPGWAHLGLAILAGLAVLLWVWRASSRPYKSPVPRYARPVPLVAQGGAAGRLAVLIAPSSPKSLALLELKSALYEGMTAAFNLPHEPTADALVKLVRERDLLPEASIGEFREMVALMRRVEAAIAAGRGARVRRAEVERAGALVHAVLDACENRRHAGFPAGAPAEPAPEPPESSGAGESTA